MSYPSGCLKPWKIPHDMWRGKTAFVLGSGPSIGNLVNSTILYNKNVIAVHDAFLLDPVGNWIDILFIGDARFYWEHRERRKLVDDFKGLKISTNIQVEGKYSSLEGCSNIKIINLVWKLAGLNMSYSNTVRYNGGAGAAAIDLAAHLGAKTIVLYGFDCKFVNGKLHHFPSVHENPKQLKVWTLKRIWCGIFNDAHRYEIELVNATPNSALPFIKQVKLEDYL